MQQKPLPINERLIEFKRRKQPLELLPEPRRPTKMLRECKLCRTIVLLKLLKCKEKHIEKTRDVKRRKMPRKGLNMKLKLKHR